MALNTLKCNHLMPLPLKGLIYVTAALYAAIHWTGQRTVTDL